MKYLAENLSDEAIDLLSECVFNSITNITDEKKRLLLRKKLMNDRNNIRFLSKPSNDLKKKRKLIPQMGRGLGVIASLLIPIISSAISGGIQAVASSNKKSDNG